jgi:imidazolonepropionase-like amidohydrolase
MDEEAAAMMKQQGVFMVPTLSALATTAACRLGCGIQESALNKAKSMTKRHHVSFKNALRDGIQIAMGTDAGTPFNFHGENAQELERMVAFGMSPMQAIFASTSAAARLIGIQDQVGTVEKGKLADLLLFKGNPLRRIEQLRDRSRIIGVMQAGKFVAGPLSRMRNVTFIHRHIIGQTRSDEFEPRRTALGQKRKFGTQVAPP